MTAGIRDLQGVLQLGNVVGIEDGGVAEERRRHGDRAGGGWEGRLAGRGVREDGETVCSI